MPWKPDVNIKVLSSYDQEDSPTHELVAYRCILLLETAWQTELKLSVSKFLVHNLRSASKSCKDSQIISLRSVNKDGGLHNKRSCHWNTDFPRTKAQDLCKTIARVLERMMSRIIRWLPKNSLGLARVVEAKSNLDLCRLLVPYVRNKTFTKAWVCKLQKLYVQSIHAQQFGPIGESVY